MPRAATVSTKLYLLILGAFVGTLACAIGGIWIYNETSLQKPLQNVLLADPRDRVVGVSVHYNGWIDTSTVVFDLDEIGDDSRPVDVFRVLLQFASAMKNSRFDSVILSAYGTKKFVIPGGYFQQLGQGFETQNPIYTIRTFAHHISTLDGAKPFPDTPGGLFWVLGEEMKQFGDFNKRWYGDDYLARHKHNG